MRVAGVCSLFILLVTPAVRGQNDSARSYPFGDSSFANLHFQLTTISQYHADFHELYHGRNSIQATAESATSVTSTLFAGVHLWSGAALYVNPELSGGSGLSGVTGIAGFVNGETPRIGDPAPAISVARVYFQQTIDLPGAEVEHLSDLQNQLAQDVARSRLTITAGKYALSDLFDNNAYSHDPRSQFENWALMENGAWDYPANTHGYTYAFTIGLRVEEWSVQASTAAEPREANGATLEYRSGAHGETLEVERDYSLDGLNGAFRLLFFDNTADMGSYALATQQSSSSPDVAGTREYGRVKYGIGLNLQQELSPNVGSFMRLGWSDGKNETWAFTEIDRTISLGLSLSGNLWNRGHDMAGVAGVINGLSQDHKVYLEAGGYGFIIGDGALTYSPEVIAETEYKLALTEFVSLTADYQFVLNPAYNRDRGPIHVLGLRAHIEI